MLLGSVTSGKLLDWDYQRVKKSIGGDEDDAKDDSFPIEKVILLSFLETGAYACTNNTNPPPRPECG
jgi:hypothetical protein